mmetsp:Transcript_91214/g.258303  ORF Transcript_91214/g.258303 Transcript_91214/m.258303 type:complete len:212 (+) Transcript_91214:106-741(+)
MALAFQGSLGTEVRHKCPVVILRQPAPVPMTIMASTIGGGGSTNIRTVGTVGIAVLDVDPRQQEDCSGRQQEEQELSTTVAGSRELLGNDLRHGYVEEGAAAHRVQQRLHHGRRRALQPLRQDQTEHRADRRGQRENEDQHCRILVQGVFLGQLVGDRERRCPLVRHDHHDKHPHCLYREGSANHDALKQGMHGEHHHESNRLDVELAKAL